MRRLAFALFLSVAIAASSGSFAAAAELEPGGLAGLQAAIRDGHWDAAGEMARDLLARDPSNIQARVQGAYALFQKGYPNSALFLLRGITAAQWRTIPQGPDRLAEIVLFFQKKVPITALPGSLEQLKVDEASSALREEIQLAKGRLAYEKGNFATAAEHLVTVSQASRYFTEAHYLLGAIAVSNHDYDRAVTELTRVFEPAVFEKSTEFWRDLGTQSTTHWGTNLRISLDAESVAENTQVAELSLLALARIAYARKDYEAAIREYDRVDERSANHPRAMFEKTWSLLQLGRHDEAARAALELSDSEKSFEAIEASPLRALILTDAGQVAPARDELDRFTKLHDAALKSLDAQTEERFPDFIKTDLERDVQLRTLRRYLSGLQSEISALRHEDTQLFPLYARMAEDLEPAVNEARDSIKERISRHVARRRADLERLRIQGKLIRAETFLEEREQLRAQYKANPTSDLKEQTEHEAALLTLLQSAVKEIDEALGEKTGNLRVDLRQSELLWELATAHEIRGENEIAASFKKRALALANEVDAGPKSFEDRARALFFTGYMLYDLAQFDAAYRVLDEYVKSFPKHEHAPDAFRLLGDARFDVDDFAGAEKLYRRILEFPDSPVVGYALYKVGWCAYNLGDYARALLGLEKAVLWTLSSGSSANLSLKRESRHDLISIYAEVGDAKKAWDYFSRFLQDDPVSWIAELARELDRIGQYEKSADLYRSLIARNPGDPSALSYDAALMHGAYLLRRWPDVLAVGEAMAAKFGSQLHAPTPLPSSLPSPSPDASATAFKENAAEAEKTFRESALGNLFEARKAPSIESTERAIRLDTLYLDTFSQWPSSEELLFKHALFLLDRERLEPAIAAFKDHWTKYGSTLPEPRREESLRTLLRALEAGESAQVESADDILAYADAYEAAYPKTQYVRAIRFLKSAVLFKHGHVAEGTALAQTLLDENPADDVGKRSFKNLRVAYYDAKNWEATYHWADGLLARNGNALAAYQTELRDIREEALFLWAGDTKDANSAAELYLKLADNPSMNRLREKALYNAFLRVEGSSKTRALQIASRLQKTDPDFAPLSDIAGTRAAYYQEVGDYERAAPLLRQFLNAPPKGVTKEQLRQATLNLGLIEEAQGQTKAALIRLKSIAADSADARHAIDRISGTDAAVKPGPSLRWAKLREVEEKFERRPLPRYGEVQSRIKKGGEMLEGISKDLLHFASDSTARPDEAMEAFCTLPFLYDRFAAALSALPDEKSLKRADAKELRKALEPIVAPIDAKAKTLGKQCLSKSAEISHTGPRAEAALDRWGWRSNEALVARVDKLTHALESKAPWLDDRGTTLTEKDIFDRGYAGSADDDSWYALAMLRLKSRQDGMSRLTLIDAMAKAKNTGRVLNALAVLEARAHAPSASSLALFEKAAAAGSPSAWANIALIHLHQNRLSSARAALERGLAAGSFARYPEILADIEEVKEK